MVKIKPLLNSLLIFGFCFFATKELLTTVNAAPQPLPPGGVYKSLPPAEQDEDLKDYLRSNPQLVANPIFLKRLMNIQNFRNNKSSRQGLMLTPPMTNAQAGGRFGSGVFFQRPVTAAGRMPQLETVAAPRPPLTGAQDVLREPGQLTPGEQEVRRRAEQEAKRRAAYRPASSTPLPPLAPLPPARSSTWPSASTALPATPPPAALRTFQLGLPIGQPMPQNITPQMGIALAAPGVSPQQGVPYSSPQHISAQAYAGRGVGPMQTDYPIAAPLQVHSPAISRPPRGTSSWPSSRPSR